VAGKVRHRYPADKDLDSLVRRVGLTLAARDLGISRPTLQHHCEKQRIATKADPKDLEGGVSDEEVLRHRVAELESELRSRRKMDVRDERIVREFEEALKDVRPRYRPLKSTKPSGRDHEHILLLSDLHAGERVSREETLGLNAFDWSILMDRLARIQRGVLSFQQHRPYPIKKLHVFFLGDMLSGTIHEELEATNELPGEKAVVQLGQDLASWLEGFVPCYEAINVVGVVGNHPRLHKKPRHKQAAALNSDYTLYKFIEVFHRGNRAFDFYFPDAKFADVMVGGWRFLLMHGDGIRSTMVSVPWGGIIRFLSKLESQFQQAGKPLDYVTAGHYHEANWVRGVSTRLFMNGSLKGVDEYVLHRFGAAAPPSQLLLTLYPKKGVVETQNLDAVDGYPNSEAIARRLAS
jgi:hypothetical protein